MGLPLLESEIPPEIPEPVRSELRTEHRALLALRTYFTAWLLLGFNVLYAIADFFVSPSHLVVLYSAKAVQVLVVVVLLRWLRKHSNDPAIVLVAVLTTASVYVLVTVQSTTIGDPLTVPLTCVLVGLISATVMPWGTAAQMCTQVVAALCVAANLLWVGEEAASFGYQHIAIVGGLMAPVFLAYRFDIDRVSLWRATWAVRDSERRFRELVETNKGLLYSIDLDGRILYISPRIEDYGYRARDVLGSSMMQLTHPDDLPAMAEALSDALRGDSRSIEFRMRDAAGEYRWFRTFGTTVVRADGQKVLNGTMTDITEQRRAEEHKAALLAVSEELAGSLDLETILARVHERLTVLIPCDVAMSFRWDSGRGVYRAIAEHGTRNRHDQLMNVEVPDGLPLVHRLSEVDVLIVNDMEAQTWFPRELADYFGVTSWMATALEVRGSDVLGAAFVFNSANRSGRKFDEDQAEMFQGIARQLSLAMEAAQLYRREKDNAEVAAALSVFGEALIAAGASEELLEILCRATSEALGCDATTAFLLDEDAEALVPAAASGIRSEEWEVLKLMRYPLPVVKALTETLEKNDLLEVVPSDSAASLPRVAAQQLVTAGITRILFAPLRRGDRIVGLLGIANRGRDLAFTSEQRQIARGIARLVPLSLATATLVEEVGRANEVKSHFVATLSHELRNLVAALRGYTFFLRSGGRLGEQDANAVRLAEACARELGELVNATLDLSRFEARRVPLDLQEVGLARLLDEMAREVQPLADAKGIEIAADLGDGNLGTIRTDPMKLRMALRNLLSNAVKFTERGGVRLEAERNGNGVDLLVRDSGVGIAAEFLATIFEPFEQAHGTESRRKGGAGLGLYLVRRLVTILGGTVTVESEIGGGSTFRIRLPLDAESATKEETAAGGDGRILVAAGRAGRSFLPQPSS